MSRLNSKLVLKAGNVYEGTELVPGFTIVKSVNTLEHGIPGGQLTRKAVDSILKNANQNRPGTGKLTVEFV